MTGRRNRDQAGRWKLDEREMTMGSVVIAGIIAAIVLVAVGLAGFLITMQLHPSVYEGVSGKWDDMVNTGSNSGTGSILGPFSENNPEARPPDLPD